jgi:hypothetical protein
MDSRCASERTVSFVNRPHPERLSPPDRRGVRPRQPFVVMGMSSRNLNNEDYFSNHPKRLPSFDALFRAQAQLSPEHFFRNLERQSGDHHCSQDDYQKAVFCSGDCNPRAGSFRRYFSSLLLCRSCHSFALHFLKSGGQAFLRVGLCWSFLPWRSFTSCTHDGKPGGETIVCG